MFLAGNPSPMVRSIMRLATARFALLCLLVAPAAAAQEFVFEGDPNSITMMQIPGGIAIVSGETNPAVERVIEPPGDRRNDAVDLLKGDRILYLNGTKIGSAGELADAYEAVAVGAEVKLGIQRGEDKMIRSFVKPEPRASFSSDDGSFRMEIRNEEGPGIPGLTNLAPWPAGFVVGENEGRVVVDRALPFPDKAPELSAIQSGDALVSLDGRPIRSVADLNERYEAIAVGADVKLEYQRKGVSATLSFIKRTAPRMKMQIRTN
jgi:S1-C subfamily serine protease